MLKFDANRVQVSASTATDDDLLDRVTVQRDDLEPVAVEIFEAELRRRGVTVERITAHGERREHEVIRREDGTVATCSLCPRPATLEKAGWQRLFGVVPYFPRTVRYCDEHRGRKVTSPK